METSSRSLSSMMRGSVSAMAMIGVLAEELEAEPVKQFEHEFRTGYDCNRFPPVYDRQGIEIGGLKKVSATRETRVTGDTISVDVISFPMTGDSLCTSFVSLLCSAVDLWLP